MSEVPGSEAEIPADLVLLAMGFVSPVRQGLLEQLALELDARGNVKATPMATAATPAALPRCLPPATCGAASRSSSGRSAKGRQCAREVDAFLMGVPICRAEFSRRCVPRLSPAMSCCVRGIANRCLVTYTSAPRAVLAAMAFLLAGAGVKRDIVVSFFAGPEIIRFASDDWRAPYAEPPRAAGCCCQDQRFGKGRDQP
jgi:hypothetical protein